MPGSGKTNAQPITATRAQARPPAAPDSVADRDAATQGNGLAAICLHTLLESLPDLVWFQDPQGVIVRCNPSFARFAGAPSTAIPGKTADVFFGQDLGDAFRALDLQAAPSGETSRLEAWLTFAGDGHRGLFQIVRTPMRDADGADVGVLGIAHEITESTRAVEERRDNEARIRALFNATSDSVILVDPHGVILAINAHGARRRGLTPEAMIGQCLYDHLSPQAAARRRQVMEKVLATRRPHSFEEQRNNAYYAITLYPVLDAKGRPQQIASFSRDVTAYKQAADTVRQLNETLERRVLERTRQLEASNQELTQALKQLTSAQKQLVESEKMASLGGLVAGVAHEINTPVGIGVTAASHLEDKTRGILEEYKAGGLKRASLEAFLDVCDESSRMILSNLRRAADLIRSFKQVAVDRSTEERRVFALRAYLEEVLLSLRPHLKKTEHRVELSCDPELTMDSYPGAISQIVANLVTNSLLHAFPPGVAGRIAIAASLEDGMVRFVYSDNGKGMTEDALGKIFEPFYTTLRGKGGTGLGLHILYNLVTQKLHGTVHCASAPGQGLTFTLALPQRG
jgi:PAS domain S-box-containing protein